MNLHKTILATEEKMNATRSGLSRFFLGAYLLFLYIILGLTHVVIVLFLPATHSFQHVNFLNERTGYTTSYSSHLRLKHNLRFGTLAYSLVLITSIVFVSTAIQIINPEKFGQSALAANLVVDSGTDIDHAGVCIPGACTLRDALNNANPGDTINFTAAFTITLGQELPFLSKAGVTIDGSVGADRVTIDCNNVASAGLNINADNVTVKDLIVKKCQFGTNVLTGADNPTFSKTTYINNTQDALNCSSGNGGSVIYAYIFGNGGSGAFLQGCTDWSITSSTIKSNTSYGIMLDGGSTGTTIDGNNINSNGQDGIYVQDVSNNSAILNNFIGTDNAGGSYGNANNGITLSGVSGATVSGNVIGNNILAGVALQGSSSNIVSNNQIGVYNGTYLANGTAAVSITEASTLNTVGQDTSNVGAANTIFTTGTNAGIQVDGSGTSGNQLRNNIYTGMSSSYVSNGSSVSRTANPVFLDWTDTRVTGTTVVGAVVDVINGGDGTRLTGATVDVNGVWTADDGGIGTASSILVMATTSSGSSSFEGKSSQTLKITNVAVSSITDTTATVTWDTNYVSDTEITCTDGTPFTLTQLDSVMPHSIPLTGLNPSSDYTCTVTSTHSSDDKNAASSSCSFTTNATPQTGDTTAPTISGVAAGTITTTSAIVTWVTDEAADSEVKYGTTTNYGSSTTDNSFVTNHSITLNGLTAATTYHYVVKSTDTSDNIGYSEDNTFTTSSSSSSYLDSVVSNIQITDRNGKVTTTTAATTSISLPLSTFFFDFTDTNHSLDAYRVQFVIALAKKNAAAIVDKTKAFDVNGKAEFTVGQSKLIKNDTYKVSAGLVDGQGNYVNPSGLAKRFTFTVSDGAPQIVSPKTINYLMPESFVVASTTGHVTVYLKDTTGKEVFHCVATMIDNIGECKPPFGAAKGLYTLEAVDPNGTSSQALYISDIAPGGILNTIPGRPEFNNRIIFTGNPTFTGLTTAGDTIEVHAPQINGAMLADVTPATVGTATPWKFTESLFTLPFGETTFTLIHRRAGVIIDQSTYLALRTPNAVKPAVIDPANNLKFANTAPVINVIGPKDHTLHIFNSAGALLYTTGYSNGSAVINLSQWFQTPGVYSVSLMNKNPLGIPSATTTFNFTIYQPAVPTPTTPANQNTNISTPEIPITTVTPVLNPITTPTTTPPSSTTGTDTVGDGIPDAIDPTVDPQAIQSISSLEKTFQDLVNSTYAISGIESLNYPMITSPAVALSTAQRNLVKTILTKDISDYTHFTIVPGNNADVQTTATTVVTITKEFNITDWLSTKTSANPATTYIVLSGQVDLPQSTQLPYALQSQPRYVVVSLFSTPVVKIAEVDTNGRWTMTIPAELLSTGEHTAYAAAEVNGTRSDQVQVAKFVIQQKNTLSNTTWLVIINIAIAFTAIVISITLQLKRKRRMV